MVEVRVEDPLEKFDEALPLLEANWRESGSPIEFKAEDVRQFYAYMAEMGAISAVGAWNDEQLVGYAITTFGPHPMNHSVRICNVDGLFLHPDFRMGIAGRLMNSVKDLAVIEGAHYIHWHSPAGSDFSKALAKRTTPMSEYFREVVR